MSYTYASLPPEKILGINEKNPITAPSNSQVPIYNSTSQTVDWGTVSSSTPTDLNITGQTAGDILYFNGTNWVRLAKPVSGTKYLQGGTTPSYSAITDLVISGQTIGNVLYFDGTNWVRLANGTSGQVLQSNGASAPSWVTSASGGADPSTLVLAYSTTIGDYTTPTSAVTTAPTNSVTTVGNTNASTTGLNGQKWVYVASGLTAGTDTSSIGINVATVGGGSFRVACYTDVAGVPSALIAESGSVAISGTGFNDIPIVATVPANGIIWFGFQCNSGTTSVYYDNTTNIYNLGQSYGAFANPFGTADTSNLNRWNMRLTISPTSALFDNDLTTKWTSTNSINPNCYVDMGSTNLSAITLYADTTNTTSTQIKIQGSTDASSWTDLRTINVSSLTNLAYNYIRFNVGLYRYIRVYGTDAGAKILSIWEIKVQKSTDAVLLLAHGHLAISSSSTSISLGGT